MVFSFLYSSFRFPIALVVYLPAGLDPRSDDLPSVAGIVFHDHSGNQQKLPRVLHTCIYTAYLIREYVLQCVDRDYCNQPSKQSNLETASANQNVRGATMPVPMYTGAASSSNTGRDRTSS